MRPIFVFGSNREGRHGKGAALEAKLRHGAIYGKPHGPQGNSYAIVTKELRKFWLPVTLEEIQRQVLTFCLYVHTHPELNFYITPLGTGLAGFKVSEIAPMFRWALDCKNVTLNSSFSNYLCSCEIGSSTKQDKQDSPPSKSNTG